METTANTSWTPWFIVLIIAISCLSGNNLVRFYHDHQSTLMKSYYSNYWIILHLSVMILMLYTLDTKN